MPARVRTVRDCEGREDRAGAPTIALGLYKLKGEYKGYSDEMVYMNGKSL